MVKKPLVFAKHLDNQHSDIKIATEIENNVLLLLLNVFVKILPNDRLGNSVYRKPNQTDRYLPANSHRHPPQKVTAILLCFEALEFLNQKISKTNLNHV